MLVGDAPTAHATSHQDGGTDELALDASQTTSGTFNVARLGTGTPTAYTVLDGTGAWTDNVPVFVPVKNTSGSTIAKGAPVFATGSVGASGAVEVAPADCDDAAKMPAIGLLDSQLTNNATGYAVVVGLLRGVDTSAYSINAPLYVATTAGQLTGTKPTGTSELIQNIGRVVRVNASNGEILVLGPGRTNDVPNAIDAGKITSGTVDNARLDAELSAIAGLTSTADRVPYFTGSGTAALATFTSAGRALVDDADASAQRTTLGLAAIAASGSASDLTTGTVPSARLASGILGGQTTGSQKNEPSTATSLLDSTITVPVCAAGDLLMFDAVVSLVQNSGSSRNVTFTARLGSTSIVATTQPVSASASSRTAHVWGFIRVHTTTTQTGGMSVGINVTAGGSGIVASSHGVATETLSSASTFDLLVTGTANTTQNYTLQTISLRRVAA
jgi:hypothetical protein